MNIRTTSEQALYRLLRLFFKKSERAHSATPPFQIGPAALGFDLVFLNPIITLQSDNDNPNYIIQVGNVSGFIISIENVL